MCGITGIFYKRRNDAPIGRVMAEHRKSALVAAPLGANGEGAHR
jgi:hypothetical protein